MNNLSAISANIIAYIKTNGIGAIQGAGHQFLEVDNFTKAYEDIYRLGYILKGVAVSTTNPGVLAENAAYINTVSNMNMTYTNLGGITVPSYQIGLFLYNGATAVWTFHSVGSLAPAVGSGDVITDSTTSVVNNVAVFNSVDGIHIVDSNIPVAGIYKQTLNISSYITSFPNDSFVTQISLKKLTGSPSIKIGTSSGGIEILDVTPIDSIIILTNVNIDLPLSASDAVYYELSGTGTALMRFDYINKMWL